MEAAEEAQKKREAVAGRESINIPLREIPRNLQIALGEWTRPELVMLTDNARLVALIGIQDITDKLCQVQTIRKKHADNKVAEEATAMNERNNRFYCKVGVFLFIFFGCVIYAATSDWSEGVAGNAVGLALAMMPGFMLLLLLYVRCRDLRRFEQNNEKMRQKNFRNRSLKIAVEALFTSWVQKGVHVGFTATGINPNYARSVGHLMTVYLPRLSGNGDIPSAEVAIAVPVNPNPPPLPSAAGRLSEAKALLEAGLITDEMFAEKQKSILQRV